MQNAINQFKIINLAEGCSFLVLLFIAMPAKYYLGEPLAVTVAGWLHGILFIAYALMASAVASKLNWSDKDTLKVLIAGMIPFAFLLINKKIATQHASLQTAK